MSKKISVLLSSSAVVVLLIGCGGGPTEASCEPRLCNANCRDAGHGTGSCIDGACRCELGADGGAGVDAGREAGGDGSQADVSTQEAGDEDAGPQDSGGDGVGEDSASPSGPLAVHPDNPRYFTMGGEAIYLTGSHTWYNLHAAPNNPFMDTDAFEAYLDWMQAHGQNFTRLWTGWSYLGYAPYPWLRTGPGDALDGKPRFDMMAFDESYFALVRERVLEIRDRGMYCSVMFFGSHNRMKSDFAGTAWHPDNNVNAALADAFDGSDGYSFFTSDPDALEIQRMLVRHFIDTLNDIPNVLWEVINEPGGQTHQAVTWNKGMADYAHAYESSYPQQHLVGMTGGWNLGKEMLSSSAEWISPDWEAYLEGGPGDYVDQIVISDTDHLPGWGFSRPEYVAKMRRWVWKTFTRGHHPIFMDPYRTLNDAWGYDGTLDPVFDPVRHAMGDTLAFARRLDLAATQPATNATVCSTTYCLYQAGVQYLVYQPQTGDFSVSLTPGDYSFEWFDPSSRVVGPEGDLSSLGGEQTFSPPFDHDAVLLLTVKP